MIDKEKLVANWDELKDEKACENCKNIIDINTPNGHERECYVDDGKIMSSPPRSWQYCEKLEEK